jgi:hypothetical protein
VAFAEENSVISQLFGVLGAAMDLVNRFDAAMYAVKAKPRHAFLWGVGRRNKSEAMIIAPRAPRRKEKDSLICRVGGNEAIFSLAPLCCFARNVFASAFSPMTFHFLASSSKGDQGATRCPWNYRLISEQGRSPVRHGAAQRNPGSDFVTARASLGIDPFMRVFGQLLSPAVDDNIEKFFIKVAIDLAVFGFAWPVGEASRGNESDAFL